MAKVEYPHNPDMDLVITKFIRELEEPGKFKPARADIHVVRMPAYNEPGWYVQSISASAFRRRMQKRHIRTFKTADGGWAAQAFAVSFWFRSEYRVEHEERRKIEARFGVDESADFTEHASLWDFYKAIGYDYKKNKLAVEPARL